MARKHVEEQKDIPVVEPVKPAFAYIKNPSGAIHAVDFENLPKTLRDPRYTLATPEEIEQYNKARGNQIAGKPRIQEG